MRKIINHHIEGGTRESHPCVQDLQHQRLGKPCRELQILDTRMGFPGPSSLPVFVQHLHVHSNPNSPLYNPSTNLLHIELVLTLVPVQTTEFPQLLEVRLRVVHHAVVVVQQGGDPVVTQELPCVVRVHQLTVKAATVTRRQEAYLTQGLKTKECRLQGITTDDHQLPSNPVKTCMSLST